MLTKQHNILIILTWIIGSYLLRLELYPYRGSPEGCLKLRCKQSVLGNQPKHCQGLHQILAHYPKTDLTSDLPLHFSNSFPQWQCSEYAHTYPSNSKGWSHGAGCEPSETKRQIPNGMSLLPLIYPGQTRYLWHDIMGTVPAGNHTTSGHMNNYG